MGVEREQGKTKWGCSVDLLTGRFELLRNTLLPGQVVSKVAHFCFLSFVYSKIEI